MTTIRTQGRLNLTQSASKLNPQKQKTVKLVYYYDKDGKQIGNGDYHYTGSGVIGYDSIAHMNTKQLAQYKIKKVVKEFSYTPEPPAPKEEKSWFNKVLDFLCA